MIILITGATHTGKTRFSQKLMEKLHIPYLSQDHLKMGLIRSGYAPFTVDEADEIMTKYLWPVTREIIKTALENKQSLIIEGCYIPFDWKKDFDFPSLQQIRFLCLCFSAQYIDKHYADIMNYESCIEARLDDGYCTKELLQKENSRFQEGCAQNQLFCALIDEEYEAFIEKLCLSRF